MDPMVGVQPIISEEIQGKLATLLTKCIQQLGKSFDQMAICWYRIVIEFPSRTFGNRLAKLGYMCI